MAEPESDTPKSVTFGDLKKNEKFIHFPPEIPLDSQGSYLFQKVAKGKALMLVDGSLTDWNEDAAVHRVLY